MRYRESKQITICPTAFAYGYEGQASLDKVPEGGGGTLPCANTNFMGYYTNRHGFTDMTRPELL